MEAPVKDTSTYWVVPFEQSMFSNKIDEILGGWVQDAAGLGATTKFLIKWASKLNDDDEIPKIGVAVSLTATKYAIL